MFDKKEKVKLGVEAEDTYSGFKGVVIARAEYINGCIQYLLRARSKENGEPTQMWFDEEELIVTAKNEVKDEKEVKQTGGPQFHPPM